MVFSLPADTNKSVKFRTYYTGVKNEMRCRIQVYEILSAINVKNLNRAFDVLQEVMMAKQVKLKLRHERTKRTIRELGKLPQMCYSAAKKVQELPWQPKRPFLTGALRHHPER